MWKSSKMHLHETCRKRENKRYSFRRCEVGSVVMSWSVFQSELRGSALSASHMERTLKLLRGRLQARLALHKQFSSLGMTRSDVHCVCLVLLCSHWGFWVFVYVSGSQFQSSRPPPAPLLCIFCMLLLSLQMFVLFERKCPAKWTSQDIPLWFQFEVNVYIPFKVHWSVQDVN